MPNGTGRPAIIVAGGTTEPPRAVAALLPAEAFVVAADSGFDHALRLGLQVDLLVGDLDSISSEGLRTAVDTGVPIEQYPTRKDETDTEMAIAAAIGQGCSEIIGVTGGGGRLDHELATLFAFAYVRSCPVRIWSASTLIVVVHGPGGTTVRRTPSGIVSLIPVHGDAVGVTTNGLGYPLNDETLRSGTARGASNEFISADATVSLQHGTLLVIVPDAINGQGTAK